MALGTIRGRGRWEHVRWRDSTTVVWSKALKKSKVLVLVVELQLPGPEMRMR